MLVNYFTSFKMPFVAINFHATTEHRNKCTLPVNGTYWCCQGNEQVQDANMIQEINNFKCKGSPNERGWFSVENEFVCGEHVQKLCSDIAVHNGKLRNICKSWLVFEGMYWHKNVAVAGEIIITYKMPMGLESSIY